LAKRAKVARVVKVGNDLALVGREAVGQAAVVDPVVAGREVVDPAVVDPAVVDPVVVDREGHVVVVTTASATIRRMNFPKKYFASTVRPRWSRVDVVSGLAPR